MENKDLALQDHQSNGTATQRTNATTYTHAEAQSHFIEAATVRNFEP